MFCIVLLCAGGVEAAQPPSLEFKFQEAVVLMSETRGDYAKAIELFDEIIREAGKNRNYPLAAQALVYQGHCLEKLGLRDLQLKETRFLVQESHPLRAGPIRSVFSPDGQQVVYNCYTRYTPDPRPELRVVRLDGSGPRTLFRMEAGGDVWPHDWSANGQQILVWLANTDQTESSIGLIDIESGTLHVLKTSARRAFSHMRFSADGRFVVYDFRSQLDSPKRDIFILPIAGVGAEAPLEEKPYPGDDYLLGWVPQSNRMLFGSDRTGQHDAWMIEIVEGRPQGEPRRVAQFPSRIEPIGITLNGTLFYEISSGLPDLYVAELDPVTGQVIDQPKPVAPFPTGRTKSGVWSSDGNFLAYLSRGRTSDGEENWKVVIRDERSRSEQEFESPVPVNHRRISWSPDGRFLLFSTYSNAPGGGGIFRMDAQTGEVTALLRNRLPNTFTQWSADGRAIFSSPYREGTNAPGILRLNLLTEQRELVFQGDNDHGPYCFDLSPDGRWLAFTDNRPKSVSLMIMPATGGEPRAVYQGTGLEELAWTPDGRYLLLSVASPGIPDGRTQLWRISIAGGEPQNLGLIMNPIPHLRCHPDGRRIIYRAGEFKRELWIMENFLPPGVPEE